MDQYNLKIEADNHFKASEFQKAMDLYKQELAVDESDNIVLNSNISACYFELGKYRV